MSKLCCALLCFAVEWEQHTRWLARRNGGQLREFLLRASVAAAVALLSLSLHTTTTNARRARRRFHHFHFQPTTQLLLAFKWLQVAEVNWRSRCTHNRDTKKEQKRCHRRTLRRRRRRQSMPNAKLGSCPQIVCVCCHSSESSQLDHSPPVVGRRALARQRCAYLWHTLGLVAANSML